MKLDKACLNALNIFPKNMEKKIISTNSTLYDILNKCKTAFGTRCLKRWMKQPLQDVKMLTKRLELLEYFIDNQGIKNIIQNELKRLPDMEKVFYIFYRVDSGKRHKCEVNDLIKLYRIITCIGELI
jgi:DNA mismatch repair protein MSH2